MDSKEIDILLSKLTYGNPENIQQEAFNKLLQISDESVHLLIKDNGKSYWQYALKVIKKIGYPKNKLAIPKLVELLQDFNWPGVPIAIEILKSLSIDIVVPYLENALQEAAEQNDFIWIAGIKSIIDDMGITDNDFEKKDTFKLLNLAEW